MPIDPGQMRKVTDHNEQVTASIRTMNEKVKNLDPRKYEDTSANVKDWTKNVHNLKVNLEKQQELSKAMRENARQDEEQHGESFRDKFSFLVDRLRDDIRFFYHSLQDFVDLPQDLSRGTVKTWDHYIHDMEMDVKKALPAVVGDNMPTALDSIVVLMNFRDALMAHMLDGMLFQKAVLDRDLKSQESYADKPMVEMAELVEDLYSKTQSVSSKLTREMPQLSDPGPFTYDKMRFDNSKEGQSPLQSRLITCLRGMQSLNRGLRDMKLPPHKHLLSANKWFGKCKQLDEELQKNKAQRHAPLEQQVENLTSACREKDTVNKQLRTQINELEEELQSLWNQLVTMDRERAELSEKNARMQKENVPMSNMFREQMKDNRANVEKHEEISKELDICKQQLKDCEERNASLRDHYFKELSHLREQVYQKKKAESEGEPFPQYSYCI